MREAGIWLSARFPQEQAYLLVWESNPARRLYERLGGRNTGIVEMENPGGGVGRYFRYVWDRPHQLAAQSPVAQLAALPMVTIRRFRASDQAPARELLEHALGEHFGHVDRNANPDLIDIARSYCTPPGAFFVAELDGNVIGTTGLIVEGLAGRLVRVAVARAHRRSGVATALMSRVADFAARGGVVELWAFTQPEWRDAVEFYRSQGFAPSGGDEIDIHLRRAIGKSKK